MTNIELRVIPIDDPNCFITCGVCADIYVGDASDTSAAADWIMSHTKRHKHSASTLKEYEDES